MAGRVRSRSSRSLVAQLAEHSTVNRRVVGSSPTGGASTRLSRAAYDGHSTDDLPSRCKKIGAPQPDVGLAPQRPANACRSVQLVGHQDSVGEPGLFVPVGGAAECGEEVGGDDGILVLAEQGL